MENSTKTPILYLERLQDNNIYIMRDDLLPFSFGGNKARKAVLFFREIEAQGCDIVVTYGSGGSNHCRIIANMAVSKGLGCHVISTDAESNCANRRMTQQFGAVVHSCPVEQVAATIDSVMDDLRRQGRKPYFIPGGGHGNVGTMAYDLAYEQIAACGIDFDYIFLASGTGTTHAGLICGKKRLGPEKLKIVGISIARANPRGGQVVADSVKSYCGEDAGEDLIFEDGYLCGGYGKYDDAIDATIRRMLHSHGLPLDPTYTGKAYCGMERYLEDHQIREKNILFIHTGGTPLFYDWVMK